MKTPAIVINFKAYAEVNGEKGLKLIDVCNEVAEESGVTIAVAPEMISLYKSVEMARIPIFAQSADAMTPGSRTGWTTLEAIKATGAVGTLINHSEHRIKLADIEYLVSRAKELGLETIVCTNNVATSRATAALEPDYVAVEPPELIGGDISVTSANPDIVSGTVEAVKAISPGVKVLCGAGVKTGRDVSKAIELGAEGVLLASGVVKASNPKEVLLDLISGI